MIGDKDSWGKGICREVIKALVEFAFSRINLEKISLGVISENTGAITCYRTAGFIVENTEVLTGINAQSGSKKIIMSIHNQKEYGDRS